MELLTDEESRTYLTQKGVVPRAPFREGNAVLVLRVSESGRGQLLLADRLCAELRGEARFLYMTAWDQDSAGEVPMFIRRRDRLCSQATGRHPFDARGLLFTGSVEDEHHDLAELVSLMLAFNWEGYLFEFGAGSRGAQIWLADEIVEITAPDASVLGRLRAAVETFASVVA